MREERTEITMAADETSGGRRSSRKKTGMLAALLALLLLLSGTFAWFYTASALNEFGGKRGDLNSAVLHDDFDEDGIAGASGELVHDKDIYVENTGANPVYVRVRLDEYMEIDEQSLIAGASRMDERTWLTHRPDGTDAADSGEVFYDYWEWQLGGAAVEYEPNIFGINGVASRYAADGTDTLVPGATGNEWTHKGQGTATEVITMTAYAAMSDSEQAAFEGWIMDEDGYCYWYAPLLPQKATGLLLDEVTLKQSFPAGSTYYYAINVVMETVDEEDLEAWLDGTTTKDGLNTPDAVKSTAMAVYLKELSESYVKITPDMAGGSGPDISDYDLDGDGYLSPSEQAAYEEAKAKYETIKEIKVDNPPDKRIYNAGETFNPEGLILEVIYEDGHNTRISSRYTYEPDGPLEAGTTEVTIWYEGVSVKVAITVN